MSALCSAKDRSDNSSRASCINPRFLMKVLLSSFLAKPENFAFSLLSVSGSDAFLVEM